jgi:hypothetical protein
VVQVPARLGRPSPHLPQPSRLGSSPLSSQHRRRQKLGGLDHIAHYTRADFAAMAGFLETVDSEAMRR